MNSELDGKIVLVTGGAGGIGSVISESFAEQGAKVIVHYKHSGDKYQGNSSNGYWLCNTVTIRTSPDKNKRSFVS